MLPLLIQYFMKIREAQQPDIKKIASLVRSLAHFYLDNSDFELPTWFSETLTERAFLERLSGVDYKNYVCEQNNNIIGYISLRKPNHLYHLFVAEPFQGMGISRLLWEHLKSCTQSNLFTLRSSIYAVPVYQQFGFVESGAMGIKDGISFQPMELTL